MFLKIFYLHPLFVYPFLIRGTIFKVVNNDKQQNEKKKEKEKSQENTGHSFACHDAASDSNTV